MAGCTRSSTQSFSPLTRPEAARLAITPRELRGPLWRSPHYGLHVWSAADALDPWQRIREIAVLVPDGGAVSGWAAGFAHGARDLDGFAADGTTPLPVLVCLPPMLRMRRGPRIRAFRSALQPTDVVQIDGLPFAAPARTAFDCARLAALEDGDAQLDAVLRSGVVRPEEVGEYAEEHRRWKGRARARQAAALADDRSRSRPESRFGSSGFRPVFRCRRSTFRSSIPADISSERRTCRHPTPDLPANTTAATIAS